MPLHKDFTRVEVRGVELRLAPKTPYLRAKQELDHTNVDWRM